MPAGTPRPIVDKLNALVREATKSEGLPRSCTRTTYGIPLPGTPEELAAFQASETKKWGEIVTVAGMQEPQLGGAPPWRVFAVQDGATPRAARRAAAKTQAATAAERLRDS